MKSVTLLAIHNFSEMKSLADSAKIRISIKYLLILYLPLIELTLYWKNWRVTIFTPCLFQAHQIVIFGCQLWIQRNVKREVSRLVFHPSSEVIERLRRHLDCDRLIWKRLLLSNYMLIASLTSIISCCNA